MKNEKQFKKPWWIRRAAYVLVAVIGLVLTGLGYATQDQVDAFTASPLLGTVVGFVAAMFTHRGSDSTATGDDVRAEREVAIAAAASHGGPSVEAIVAEALKQVNSYGEHALGEAAKHVRSAVDSTADYYASQE